MVEVPQPPSEAEQSEEVEKDIQDQYQKTVKDEADKHIDEVSQEAGEKAAEISKLGFPTKKEMLGELAALKKENEALKAEFTKLREFLLRSKAQGKAVIPTEEKPTEQQELKKIYGDLLPDE